MFIASRRTRTKADGVHGRSPPCPLASHRRWPRRRSHPPAAPSDRRCEPAVRSWRPRRRVPFDLPVRSRPPTSATARSGRPQSPLVIPSPRPAPSGRSQLIRALAAFDPPPDRQPGRGPTGRISVRQSPESACGRTTAPCAQHPLPGIRSTADKAVAMPNTAGLGHLSDRLSMRHLHRTTACGLSVVADPGVLLAGHCGRVSRLINSIAGSCACVMISGHIPGIRTPFAGRPLSSQGPSSAAAALSPPTRHRPAPCPHPAHGATLEPGRSRTSHRTQPREVGHDAAPTPEPALGHLRSRRLASLRHGRRARCVGSDRRARHPRGAGGDCASHWPRLHRARAGNPIGSGPARSRAAHSAASSGGAAARSVRRVAHRCTYTPTTGSILRPGRAPSRGPVLRPPITSAISSAVHPIARPIVRPATSPVVRPTVLSSHPSSNPAPR
jgi:hypothetical protein